MGFDLNALASKSAVVNVEFMGQSALVTYNPAILTSENVSVAQKSEAGFVSMFTDLVTDWDVKRGTRKVPIDEKNLHTIPLQFLKAIFGAILGDSQAGAAEEGKASSDG